MRSRSLLDGVFRTMLYNRRDDDDGFLLRDRFPGNAEPLTSDGLRTVTGTDFFLDGTGLRGGGQAAGSAAWGASEVRYPTKPITRANGVTLVGLHTVEDADNEYAFGFSTSQTAIDPRTDGHGILIENKAFNAITPGAKLLLDSGTRMTRPMQYLYAIVLLDEGAALYISTFGDDSGAGMIYPPGIPQYPAMRLLYVTRNGTTTPLYPYISAYDVVSGGYQGGHRFQDLRVMQVASWAEVDALCAAADRFTRADSASTLGADWTIDNGTFGISSNRAYTPSLSGFGRAWMESGVSDAIVSARLTFPSGGFRSFGLMLRRQDADNLVRLWFDSNTVSIQTWVNGGFGETIAQTGYAITAGNTYRVTCIMSGNKYRLFINDVDPYGDAWVEDTNSRFVTATKHGLYILADTGYADARWDDFAVYPLEVTAPIELQSGAKPTIFTAGETIAYDEFEDTDSTPLEEHTPDLGNAWTEHIGGWTIEGNQVSLSTQVSGSQNFVTMDIGRARDFEISCKIHVADDATEIYAGIVACYSAPDSYIAAVPLRVPIQLNSDEVEFYEAIPGKPDEKLVVRKVNVGLGEASYYADGSSHDLKLQVSRDDSGAYIAQVWLDGEPRITYPLHEDSPTGTRAGFIMQLDGYEDHDTRFSDWSVKAL